MRKGVARNVFKVLEINRSEDLILHAITQATSKDEVIGTKHCIVTRLGQKIHWYSK